MNNRQQGFTLVEVLLAISIAAVIAVVAYQALSSASDGAARTREVIAEINQLDRTWQILAADLRNVLPPEVGPRGPRFEFMGSSLRARGDNAEQGILVLARGGWVNLLERQRSDMQRVSYRVSQGQLWRDYIPERNLPLADIDFEYDAFQQLLLEGVEDIQMRFLSADVVRDRGRGALEGFGYSDSWPAEWPPGNQLEMVGLPLAVQITIEITGIGASVRLFELNQPPP